MADDLSLGKFDHKTGRLGFDEREVSLHDIRRIARNHFKNVDVNRIVVEDHNNWKHEDNFHIFLSVRSPIDPALFVKHQSGSRSCTPGGVQTLGALIEQAEVIPNCDLRRVRLVNSPDHNRISVYFDADCQLPGVAEHHEAIRRPIFQPLGGDEK